MKPVLQQVISPKNGDCLRACIATLLEVEAGQVPNFAEASGGYCSIELANLWLEQYGLALFQTSWVFSSPYANWFALNNVLCIFSVPSQKFPKSTHAVVGRIWNEEGLMKWEVVHDPNPNNAPYPWDVEIVRVSFLVKSR